MTVAPFVYADWLAQFPQFSNVTQPQAQAFFNQATLYVDNTDCSLIPADPVTYEPRQMILYLLTAQQAQLLAGSAGSAPSGLVGRISDASEGSVKVSVALGDLPPSAVFFTQTQFGLMAYQALAPYRLAQPRLSPGRFQQSRLGGRAPFGLGYGGYGGGFSGGGLGG